MAKLKSLDECADRIEAAGLTLRPTTFDVVAHQLRNGQFDLSALSNLRREADRLLEGLNSAERILAEYQGRAG